MFTFEYEKDSQYSSLDDNFYEILSYNSSKETLRKTFLDNGIIGIDIGEREDQILFDKFNNICNQLGSGVVRDAIRRTKTYNNFEKIGNANSVDPDAVHRPHAEASFSPAKPAIICFVCSDIEEKAIQSGMTTIMDGKKIWKELDISTKKCLLNSVITYDLAIDIPLTSKNKNNSRRDWYLDAVGADNVEIDKRLGKIYLKFKTPFVTDHPLTRDLALANHAFIDPKTESQILNREVNLVCDNSCTKAHVKSNVFNVIRNNIKTIQWKKGRCLFIDNYRFMHGRLPYDLKLKRKILIKQLKKFAVF